mmetsp:Transcript_6539/g.18705  ORF Transcript_6539/g.18705 Transcript_6539/m.18705 type:complete len:302 (+) Transcript_6539:878-1783(+)
MDLINESSHLLLVHLPHLAELLFVCHLEVAALLLQVLELPRQPLVLLCECLVLAFVLLVEAVVPAHKRVQVLAQLVQAILVRRLNCLMLLVPLRQHLKIIVQLLPVQQVGGHHLLKVLLQFLDALLQSDLAFVVVIHELRPQVFDVLLEASFPLLPSFEEFGLLHLPALLEQGVNLRFVLREELAALLFEGLLYFFQLLLVAFSHRLVLLAHLDDQRCDVGALLLQHLYVLLVLILQLLLKISDSAVLRVDDLLTGLLLELELLVQLLRDVLVQQIRPFHLNRSILAAASHSLDLERLVPV